ncbi:MAG: hypothetical protein KJ587_02155, partial [Alphaproteobacteria bacterium]|nr:hypothetical protein [Alphaproteobacteria bacterium]
MVTFNRGDLDFILDQILMSEGENNIFNQALALDPTLPFGIRTVSGVNNNLLAGQQSFGAADDPFPKLVDGTPLNDADGDTFDPDGPFGPAPPITNNDYGQPGNVADADPRIISNLTVDQSTKNPAAVAAALLAAGIEGAEFNQGLIDIPAAYEAYQAALAPIQGLLDAQAAAQTTLTEKLNAQTTAAGNLTAAQGTLTAYDNAVTEAGEAVSPATDAQSGVSLFVTVIALNQAIDPVDSALLSAAILQAQATATEAADVVTALTGATVAQADIDAAQVLADDASLLVTQLTAIETALNDDLLNGDGIINQQQLDEAGAAVLLATTIAFSASNLTAQLTASQTAAAGDVATATTVLQTADAEVVTAQGQFDAAESAASGAQATADAAQATLDTTLETYGVELEADGSLVILNVAPDEGLSAPFNSWFVLFGQFFDHGLDLINKGGNGTVYVPLQPDDPLYDPNSPQTNFMVLTRATLDENGEPTNATSPFVDQNQTYTSHEAHQVFIRGYELNVNGQPEATGKLIEGTTGGMATWRDVKDQAADKLGILLEDTDVVRVPLLATDLYGNFIPGANGFPQIVLRTDFVDVFGQTLKDQIDPDNDGLVEGNPADPIPAAYAEATGHAFLDDIAHNAVPGTVYDADGNPATPETAVAEADADDVAGNAIATDFRGRKVAYDDELLDEHFIAGDGRVNENIGLTAVHHIFHSEHNRLAEHTQDVVIAEGDLAFANQWLDQPITQVELDAINALSGQARTDAIEALDWNGERLFQAAKFGTEMQYQHLVFEEFARKVQPQVNVFAGYDITIDAKIVAEFAHAVYRFGHSQLRENVDVVDADGNLTEFGLIEAFLNPLDFDANNTVDADIAAGAIVRGMTRQQGSEIDEFVTGALRNNLLGLPLDLATLNIARARETGVPTLNEFRSEMYSLTSDPKLKPYESWVDFAAHAKHELSVVNFIAAYGTHELITSLVDDGNGGLREKTLDEKRDAAMELVLGVDLNGDNSVPADRLDFLNSTGAWTAENSGLNAIDLWIGGLAEAIEPFGGMLGSTFNFVFEIQLENLQDGDRFYYLARVAGLHFLNQLEGNSFAGLIQRNTDLGIDETDVTQFTTHLPGDIFSLPGFILEAHVANQQDYDPNASETDRPIDLGRDPQGNSLFSQTVVRIDADNDGNAEFLKYTGGEHIVLGGTNLNDHLVADIGDDTLWGDGGDDFLEGGDGADSLNGGSGDDILVDVGGAGDNFKGDDGNDVIVAGSGEALILAGAGNDYVLAGQDLKETFGGEGNDFIQAGDGSNIVFGGEGDDWIEGGAQADLLQGDNGAPFQDSPVIGNDVIIGGGGNDDYDSESGDDIMLADPGITRHEGMLGFDWTTHKGDTQPGNSDFLLTGALLPAIDANRDRFDAVEGLSGWQFNDQLRGDDRTGAEIAAPAEVAVGEGGLGGHELRNFDLINGLRDNGANPEALFTADTTEFFGGNIILGGGGSDIIEGRGGDDVIDGDKWLNVRLEIRDANDVVLGSVNSMTDLMTVDNTTAAGAALVGKTVNEMMLTRELNPGMLNIVREILDGAQVGDVDIAQFSGARSEYLINATPDELGFITVSHIGGAASDGVDRVRNIEALQFADALEIIDPNIQNNLATGLLAITESTPASPPSVGDTFTVGIGTVDDLDGVPPISEFSIVWQVEATFGAGDWEPILDPVTEVEMTGLTFTPTPAMEIDGLRIRAVASFIGGNGIPEFVLSAPTVSLAAQAVAAATNGDDLLIGTVGNDGTLLNPIDGLAGDDTILGLAGNDVLAGGAGNDLVDGGDGADILFGNGGSDELFGGQGQDQLDGGAGDDLLDGGTQADTLIGGAGDDLLLGGAGADTLIGGAGSDIINGGGGNDTAIFEADIADVTFAATPTGTIEVVDGAIEDEVIDVEFLQFADGAGTTTITLADAQDAAGAVRIAAGVTLFNAGGGAQFVIGNDVAETINGEGGADIILGEGGPDIINGGNGADALIGGAGGDTLNGDAGADFLSGGNGSDTLNGGAGADTLQGDAGDDTIFGDAGNDTAVWNIGDGQDVIDGGGNGAVGDTFQINGSRNGETYRIYALTDNTVSLPVGLVLRNPSAAIAVTYDDGTGEQIIGELTDIEEITLNADAIVASVPGLADVRGDNVEIIGNFTGTGLALNTITINGSTGDDVIDISGLSSQHRIVFNSMGGDDTILGNLRPQDIIELSPGQSAALFNDQTTNGMTTRSFSTGQSITFTAGLVPTFVNGIGAPQAHAAAGDGF